MKRTLSMACTGLAWLLLAPVLAASPVSNVYLADAEAEIAFDSDGVVTAVEVQRTPALEGEVGDRLEERMRNWRFDVVRNENGEAVPARTNARLVLEGRETEPGRIEVRMNEPVFTARSLGQRHSGADFSLGGQRVHRVTPKYPKDSARVSARVLVLAEFDASGRVLRAGARKAMLMGVQVSERETGRAQKILQPFVRESERAIARWRFPPAAEGETGTRSVLVPVSFLVPPAQRTLTKWELAVSVHSLERDWAQPGKQTSALPPQALPDDDGSFNLVRLVDSIEGQLL